MGLEIDFDNLRKQTAESFSQLTDILNSNIRPGEGIHVATWEIEDTMKHLKTCILAICACYNDEPEKIESVDDIEISTFNPKR